MKGVFEDTPIVADVDNGEADIDVNIDVQGFLTAIRADRKCYFTNVEIDEAIRKAYLEADNVDEAFESYFEKLVESIISPMSWSELLEESNHLFSGAFQNFFIRYPSSLTWGNLLEAHSVSGENILHLTASSPKSAGYLHALGLVLTEEKFNDLIMETDAGGDTPLNLTCQHVNTVLFEFIAERLKPEGFQAIAAMQNLNLGYNAFHWLIIACYNRCVFKFKGLFEQQESLPEGPLSRQQVPPIIADARILMLMARFGEILGQGVEALATKVDYNGNDAVMLCAFTLNAHYNAGVWALFKDVNNLQYSLMSELPGTKFSPVKLFWSFGSLKLVEACIDRLNQGELKLAPLVCLLTDALGWAYYTTVSARESEVFVLLVKAMADGYGDYLEAGVIESPLSRAEFLLSLIKNGSLNYLENEFRKNLKKRVFKLFHIPIANDDPDYERAADNTQAFVVENHGRGSILLRSLNEDGIIPQKIIEKPIFGNLKKQHIHKQIPLMCELLYDMRSAEVAPARGNSPRFFLSPIRAPLGGKAQLRRRLLTWLLKIEWPYNLLQFSANALIAKLNETEKTEINIIRAILQIINERAEPRAWIPLSLFHKVASSPLQPGQPNVDAGQDNAGVLQGIPLLEKRFIDGFQENDEPLQSVREFYGGLKLQHEGEALARNFCERILDSRSIFKVALLKKMSLSEYDKECRAQFANVAGIKALYVKKLEENFAQPQVLVEVIAAN
jgi:hypothetical protein